MKILKTLLAAVTFLLLSGPLSANADFVIVPTGLENVGGNSSNAFPFNTGTLPSQRYQQVYASSDFRSLGSPLLITEITFRPEGNEPGFSLTLPDTQINLSTTSREPDNLSGFFSVNVGADDAVVFGRGPLALSSASTGPPAGPRDFDIVIELQMPFLYDPRMGNLLLDVRNFAGRDLAISFDAEETLGDAVSRVFTNASIPGGVDSPVGATDAIATLGLVTRFTFTPGAVPAPSTLVLLGVGLAGAASLRRRKVD